MRRGTLCLIWIMLSLGTCAQAEEARDAGCSTHLSLSANSQISALQQRLKDSEALRDELNQQLQTANNDRESAQSSRLHQDNQRLRQQLAHALSTTAPTILTDQQQWFVVGAAVALLALLCGVFASGGRRARRQWLN